MRKKNEPLSELEEEAKQKMEYMRQNANEIIKEQNEEIKEINKVLYIRLSKNLSTVFFMYHQECVS